METVSPPKTPDPLAAIRSSAPSRRWRRLPLRFSLRLLLLGITAFAVGFPVWYRWPYEEAVVWRSAGGQISQYTTFTTWQRQWGGGRLKHGSEREFVASLLESETTYERGVMEGPFTSYYRARGVQTSGQYSGDQKTGTWTHYDRDGRVTTIESWRSGLLDGNFEVHPADGPVQRMLFAEGRLISVNDRPATCPLLERLKPSPDQTPQSDRTQQELALSTELDLIETPLRDAVDFLASQHNLPMMLDPNVPYRDVPITLNLSGTNLSSALILLTAPHDLAADYRYGCIWITTAEDCRDWHDPTGVADIEPPPGSQLARLWSEEPAMSFIETPVGNALRYLEQSLAIDIDESALLGNADASRPVTLNVQGLPFSDVLGLLLYHAHCRCELQGETLVIGRKRRAGN